MDWIWKSILIILVGTFLLRIAGRKSISQMTLAQTVIMIAIGSLLIQPVAGKNIWVTFGVGGVLVIILVILEYSQVKINGLEKLFTGKAVPLVEDGQLNEKNLKKLRFTVDQFEMNLRQQQVSSISDVKTATIEPNGQIGIELKEISKPVTKKDLQRLQLDIDLIKQQLGSLTAAQPISPNNKNIFNEVEQKNNNDQDHPDRLK